MSNFRCCVRYIIFINGVHQRARSSASIKGVLSMDQPVVSESKTKTRKNPGLRKIWWNWNVHVVRSTDRLQTESVVRGYGVVHKYSVLRNKT